MIQGPLAVFLLLGGMALLVRPVIGGTYDSQLELVGNKLSELDVKISDLEAVAESNGHSEVHQLCESAKTSLSLAQSAWKDEIASLFGDQPWLASESSAKTTVEKHLSSCGKSLQKVYEHPHVKPEPGGHPSYAFPVQACQSTYDSCQSACQSVWDWRPPKPVPSGGYYKRQLLARREREKVEMGQCPSGETACPISPASNGVECLDIQTELTSCGGCVSINKGENCMEIPGAAGVGCKAGKCLVLSVQTGYYLGPDGRPVLRRGRV